MKTIKQLAVGMIILFSLILVASVAWGNDIKERMKQRLPAIVKMKKEGIIGENARGYLEYVSKAMHQDVVQDENRDRKTVYGIIAKQQGVDIEKVEKLRAVQIFKKADKGDYLKNDAGKWYRK